MNARKHVPQARYVGPDDGLTWAGVPLKHGELVPDPSGLLAEQSIYFQRAAVDVIDEPTRDDKEP